MSESTGSGGGRICSNFGVVSFVGGVQQRYTRFVAVATESERIRLGVLGWRFALTATRGVYAILSYGQLPSNTLSNGLWIEGITIGLDVTRYGDGHQTQ